MKKWIIGLMSIGLLATTAVMAYPGGGQHKRGHDNGKRIEKMLDAVDASAQQRAAILSVIEAQKPARKSLRTSSRELHKAFKALDPTSGGYAAQVQAFADQHAQLSKQRFLMRAETRQQIAMNLTDEQRAKLAELKQQRHEKRAAKFKGRDHAGRSD